MASADELLALEQRLSLALPEASGVGLREGRLAVYLADVSAEAERSVRRRLRAEAPGVSGRCCRERPLPAGVRPGLSSHHLGPQCSAPPVSGALDGGVRNGYILRVGGCKMDKAKSIDPRSLLHQFRKLGETGPTYRVEAVIADLDDTLFSVSIPETGEKFSRPLSQVLEDPEER